MTRYGLAFATMLICSVFVFAQAPAGGEPGQSEAEPQKQSFPEVITPVEKQAREQAVMELVKVQMPREKFNQYMQAVAAQVIAMTEARAAQTGKPMPPEEIEKLKRTMLAVVTYDEMVRSEAEIYSSHFTVDEIHQMRDFYRTPVGEKFTRLLPVIMQETMTQMFTTIDQRVRTTMEKEDKPDSERH